MARRVVGVERLAEHVAAVGHANGIGGKDHDRIRRQNQRGLV